MKVYVAMSGGVDSSVAALLLREKGFDVVGVFMKPWQPAGLMCMWQRDRHDALRVASHLDIPLLTWDFSKQYGSRVAKKMIEGYRNGITPNPDVDCNKEIKFGLLYDKAMKCGADFVATGHYAKIVRGCMQKARDSNKDQTYFLWAIRSKCLAKTLFPIGNLTKHQVREIAKKHSLFTADKKDSQGVCFVGDLDVKHFLVGHIKSRAGSIVHSDGRVIGMHDGAEYYTIGQRHGLNIKDGAGPYFVIRKDIKKNTITVGDEKDLYSRQVVIRNTNWFGTKPKVGSRVQVKVRYRTPAHPATIVRNGLFLFDKPVKAIAPGQSAVLYRNSILLGGGIISG